MEGEREKAFFLYLLVESKATAVMVAEATVGAVGARVAAPARCQLWLAVQANWLLIRQRVSA